MLVYGWHTGRSAQAAVQLNFTKSTIDYLEFFADICIHTYIEITKL